MFAGLRPEYLRLWNCLCGQGSAALHMGCVWILLWPLCRDPLSPGVHQAAVKPAFPGLILCSSLFVLCVSLARFPVGDSELPIWIVHRAPCSTFCKSARSFSFITEHEHYISQIGTLNNNMSCHDKDGERGPGDGEVGGTRKGMETKQTVFCPPMPQEERELQVLQRWTYKMKFLRRAA